ncbi:MAG: hypothetical protein IJY61_06630 [Candidatus Gastranaerophilales bacterium]|nr:hypothetical protein [Candidatus Gastranaerophilales bacterium]
MFSLVLCGKTYPDHQNNNTLTFWLMHTEIQPLFTLLLIYPCTIYAGYLSTLLNSKKIIYIILIIITITLFSTRTHNNLTHIYSDEVHPLRQKNIRQYQYEKMIKFYMLKNIKPNIPLVYSQEDFPELDDKIYYSQIEKQLYFNSVVYKMNNIRELGYNLTEDALEQFKKDGGSFSDEELKYPKFGRLFDDTFVLNTKTNVPL